MASMAERPSFLLLLPPAPQHATRDTLNAAYRPPVTAVLRELAGEIRTTGSGAILDIALPMPHLLQNRDAPRSALYDKTQFLVAGLYKLICVVAASDKINVEDYQGIDVRILMLAYAGGHDGTATSDNVLDPVISLQTLAQSKRGWDRVIAIDSSEGDQILGKFSAFQSTQPSIHKVAPGAASSSLSEAAQPEPSHDSVPAGQHHLSVVVGGTFDHIHIGHKLLLTMFAFLLASAEFYGQSTRVLTIGVTNDEQLKNKKYQDLLESWDERQSIVLTFLRAIIDFRPDSQDQTKISELSEPGPNGHAIHAWLDAHLVIKCVEINDPFGPTITVEDISAMAISAETRSGGKAVNDKRKDKGWAELELFEVDVLDAEEAVDGQQVDESFQAKLSSTSIRKALSERAQVKSKV